MDNTRKFGRKRFLSPEMEAESRPDPSPAPAASSSSGPPCPVCGEAMGKEASVLHYGGACCLSCRAFFRRAHQVSLIIPVIAELHGG